MTGRWVGCGGLVVLLAWPLACSSFNGVEPSNVTDAPDAAPTGDIDSGGVSGQGDVGIGVDLGAMTTAYVIQGQTLEVPVTLTRHPGSQGPVSIVLTGLPPKVSADMLIIPENAVTGSIKLRADAQAVQGATKVVLSATSINDQATASATPTVFVRGPGGTADPTFAGTGYIPDTFPGDESEATDAKVLSDGSILVSGKRNFYSVVSRYKADGTLDTSFGTGGTVNLGATDAAAILDVYEGATPAQGFIYALEIGGTDNTKLFRVKLDGTLDTAFGSGGGVAVVDGLSGAPTGAKVFALPTGKALVAVRHGNSPPAFSRWLSTGQIDTSYGANGACALGGLGDAYLKADGSVITAYGDAATGSAQGCNAQGLPDSTVAPDPSFRFYGGFTNFAVEKDGSFLFLTPPDNLVGTPSAITHFSSKFVVDTTFKITFTSPGIGPSGTMMLVHPDGGVLVANRQFVVGRFTLPGGSNHDFGTAGVASYQVNAGILNQLVLQPDGRILALGKSSGFFGAILRIWP